jgi:hypothetical protein
VLSCCVYVDLYWFYLELSIKCYNAFSFVLCCV